MEQAAEADETCEGFRGPEKERVRCTALAVGRYRGRRVVGRTKGVRLCAECAREHVLRFGWRRIGNVLS